MNRRLEFHAVSRQELPQPSDADATSRASADPLIVFSALGTLGDVNPIIAIASQLKARGYRIVFLSNEHFADEARHAGVPFISVGSASEYHAAYKGEIWDRKSDRGIRNHFLDYHLPGRLRGFARLQTLYAQNSNLVVVSLGAQDGPALAAQKFGLPLVEVIVTATDASVSTPETIYFHELHLAKKRWGRRRIELKRFQNRLHLLTQTIGPAVNVLRSVLGLPRVSLWRDRGSRVQLSLAMLPDWYLSVAGTTAPTAIPVGFALYDSVDVASRERVDDFIRQQGRPLVFTPGSGVSDVKAFLLIALEVSANLNLPCILLSREWRQVSESMTERALGCDYVDLVHVLPRALALIHHGGIGTCAQAIRAGIPQLIRPLQFDQFENGYRIWKLGLGAYIFQESFTAAKCTSLLRSMLEKAPKMKRLDEYARRVGGVSGAVVAADHIANFLQNNVSTVAPSEVTGSSEKCTSVQLDYQRPSDKVERAAPFFTVIVFASREARELGRTLRSVLEQDFRDFEAVVFGPDLDTRQVEVLSSHEGWLRRIDSGTTSPCHDWLRALRGEWLVVIEADDEWMPNLLRQHHERLQYAPQNVGMTWCKGCELDHDEGSHATACRTLNFDKSDFSRWRTRNPFRSRRRVVGVCVRRQVLTRSTSAMSAFLRRAFDVLPGELSSHDAIAGSNAGVLSHRYVSTRHRGPSHVDAGEGLSALSSGSWNVP